MADVTVDRCPACRGLWFDRGEIGHVLDLRTQGLAKDRIDALSRELADQPPTAHVADASLGCVRCGKMMDRQLAAPRSQILVDLCKDHGLWFDGGEFEAFEKFVAGEGLEILRAWEDFSTKPSRHAAWRRHDLSESDGYAGSGDF